MNNTEFYSNKSDELVSIILPVLNPNPLFFSSAVESLLNQNYQNIEIIIVEAPSECTGEKIVRSFRDPRIRYVLNPVRTSLRDQLNQAIEASSGLFIARMDADDVAVPDRILTQLMYLQNNTEVSLVGSCLEVIDENNNSLGFRQLPETHDEIVRGLRIYCTIAHPSIMFRKSDIIEMGGYQDSAPMEDWDLWCRMAISGKKFYNLQVPLLKYRVHAQAGKVTSLRKTLQTGIELKKRYFKNVSGCWGIKEQSRCCLEYCLMLLPPRLVLKLFFILSLRPSIVEKRMNS
jgi:glycosyltransferase involved in cell wall biosynthesis